jgi:hypothetical protein
MPQRPVFRDAASDGFNVFSVRVSGDAPRATGVGQGDLDGDKDLDIVVPGRYEAAFAEHRPFGVMADDTTSGVLGDIDNDSALDILRQLGRASRDCSRPGAPPIENLHA